MKLVLLVLIKFGLILGSFAQKKKIEIDAKFPFEDIFGWRGKNVIIEFFSSSCTSCFRALPKLDSLNVQYKGRIGFQLVGKKDKAIEKIYTYYEKKFNLTLPIMYDSIYFSQLEIEAVPFLVWVNENGIVKGLSHGGPLNSFNLDKFLGGEVIKEGFMGVKQGSEQFDNTIFFQNENIVGENKNFVRKSVLSRWQPKQRINLPPHVYPNSAINKFETVGAKFQDLLNYAYFGYRNWDVKNPLYLTVCRKPILNDSFLNLDSVLKISYCYSIEKESKDLDAFDIQTSLQHEISKAFRLNIQLDTQMMPVWRLTADTILTKKLRSEGKLRNIATRTTELDYKNVSVIDLVNFIDSRTDVDMPIIDDTGINYNLDIRFSAILYDFNDVKAAIEMLGFQLIEDKRLMKVLKIKPQL